MSSDITRPHISRIYDYVLGGTHNHEVDRRAGDAMIERMPSYPRWAKQNRAFLDHMGKLWASEGRDRVLDLGSGLPTQGHFNAHLPGARILFADIDAQTVALGREILASTPDMAYAEVDLRDPDALLDKAAGFFGSERRLAVGLIGIAYFLTDDELRALSARLHTFCAPGSVLALSFPAVPQGKLTDEETEVIHAMEKVAQIRFTHRAPEEIVEIVKPWRVTSVQQVEGLFDIASPTVQKKDPLQRMEVFGAVGEHE